MGDRYGFNPGYGLFPSGGGGNNTSLFPAGAGGNNTGLFPGAGPASPNSLFPASYSNEFDPGGDAATDFVTQEEATVQAGSAPVVTSGGFEALGPGSAEFQGKTRTFDAATWQAAGQWDDELLAAAAAYGVPANRLKAQMMIESGGQWVGPDGQIVRQNNPYNGDSYGLMQIVVQAAPGACSDDWCGWGDGSDQTKATGVNHNVFTPDGNIMMGAMVLSDMYHQAKSLYPNLSDDQLWDMASSAFFVGNMQWDGGDSVNGNSGAAYKQDMDTLIASMGQASGVAPGQDPTSIAGPTELVDQASGNTLVDAALSFLGTDYVWGAPYGTASPGEPTYFDQSGRPTAFDCSGFISYLAKTYLGMDVSTGSHELWNDPNIRRVGQNEPLAEGDILFFDTGTSQRGGNNASHVGIFVGYDAQGVPWMINALNESAGVVLRPLTDEYWTKSYMGAKRLVG